MEMTATGYRVTGFAVSATAEKAAEGVSLLCNLERRVDDLAEDAASEPYHPAAEDLKTAAAALERAKDAAADAEFALKNAAAVLERRRADLLTQSYRAYGLPDPAPAPAPAVCMDCGSAKCCGGDWLTDVKR